MNNLKKPYLFTFLIVFSFFDTNCYSQTVLTEAYNGKEYRVYTSLSDANKVNRDSVEGLVLCSNGFLDFPREILKFKNLKYLNICSESWRHHKDSLTDKQIKINDSIEIVKVIEIDFKPNHIKSIPKKMKKMKKLEMIDFSTVYFTNKNMMKVAHQLYQYFPKATRLPSYETMKADEVFERTGGRW
jgi:hypothetical protein